MKESLVDFRLSTIKSGYVYMLDFFSSDKGKEVIAKGWKRAELTGLVHGTITLPPADPKTALQI